MASVVGPVVWLLGRVIAHLQAAMRGLERARTLHSAQVHLRVAAEQALEKAAARRDRARQVEVAGLVIGGVVHDLRNSLGVLQLWSGSLREEPTADETVHAAAERIEGWCTKAGDLTRELIDMSRPARVAGDVCPVRAQANAAVAMLQRTLPEDIAVIGEDAVEADLEVAFDAAALTSVILGLAASVRLGPDLRNEIRVVVREPAGPERDLLAACAAVVELVFGAPSTLPSDPALAEEVADQGGRLLFDELADKGTSTVRLLLPAARQPTPLEEAMRAHAV
jgi:signal transduction histidine kinase